MLLGINIDRLGAPGSGKGTLCRRLADECGFRHLSVGDLLRRLVSTSSASELVTDYLQRGEALPGDILVPVLKEQVDELGDGRPTLLDGFPRRLDQTSYFEKTVSFARMITTIETYSQLLVSNPRPCATFRLSRENGGRPGLDETHWKGGGYP